MIDWLIDWLIETVSKIIRSTLLSRPNKVGLNFRLGVRPSTKCFFDISEIWHVGRGRWVMHDVQYDPIQGHVGIPGNEKADKSAKSALNKPVLWIPILYTHLKPIINKYIHNKWQQTWNSQTQNKLYQLYPTIASYSTLSSSSQWKDQIIYYQLLIWKYSFNTFLSYWTHRSSKMYKL